MSTNQSESNTPANYPVEIITGRRGARVVPGFQLVNKGDHVTFRASSSDVTLMFFDGNPFTEGDPISARFFIKRRQTLQLQIREDVEPDIYPYKAFSHAGTFALAGSDPEILVRDASGG